jgi:hypothetical protein
MVVRSIVAKSLVPFPRRIILSEVFGFSRFRLSFPFCGQCVPRYHYLQMQHSVQFFGHHRTELNMVKRVGS